MKLIRDVAFCLKFSEDPQNNKNQVIREIGVQLEQSAWKVLPRSLPGKEPTSNSTGENKAGKQVETSSGFTASSAGIGGIQRRLEREQRAVGNVRNEALSDLKSLIQNASDVVKLVQRYAQYAGNESKNDTSQGEDDSDGADVTSVFENIGLVAPVTKSSSGSHYHAKIAEQVDKLLRSENRIEKLKGIITLTDLFGMYNRARGSELVSPHDLLMATKLFKPLGLGLALERLPSGAFIVVDTKSTNEETFVAELAKSAAFYSKGLDATQVAGLTNTSFTMAQQRLDWAERRGLLCRDNSVSGTFFFPNRFNEFQGLE